MSVADEVIKVYNTVGLRDQIIPDDTGCVLW